MIMYYVTVLLTVPKVLMRIAKHVCSTKRWVTQYKFHNIKFNFLWKLYGIWFMLKIVDNVKNRSLENDKLFKQQSIIGTFEVLFVFFHSLDIEIFILFLFKMEALYLSSSFEGNCSFFPTGVNYLLTQKRLFFYFWNKFYLSFESFVYRGRISW